MLSVSPARPTSGCRPAATPARVSPYRVTALLWIACSAAGLAADPLPAEASVQVKTVAGPLAGGTGGVAVDALGFVYVADFGEKVWKISPEGEVEIFVDSLYGTSGNTIDAEGNLLQSNFFAGTVSKIARDGTVSTLASGLAGPVGLTVSTDGRLYACNCKSNVVSRISPAGEVSDFSSGDLFNCPNGLTHDDGGNLYVVNFADGRLIAIDAAGQGRLLATIPGGGNGHVVWLRSELYVAALRANRIFKVTADGQVTWVAGSGDFGEQDGPAAAAAFSTPNGIAFHPTRDALYVNDRLQTWGERWGGRTSPTTTVRELLFPTLEETTLAAFAAGGAVGARSALSAYAAARPGRPYLFILNRFGYQLLQDRQLEAATAVFEVNTELFPKASNTWDSLADAHKAAGHREQAIACYRKSLALDPANANAAAMLEELGAE